jgi:hypothetical protein
MSMGRQEDHFWSRKRRGLTERVAFALGLREEEGIDDRHTG